MMECDFSPVMLTAYALEELGFDERAAVDEHLRDCESCRQAVSDVRALGDSLCDGLAKELIPAPAVGWRVTESRRLEEPLESRRGRVWTVAIAASLLLIVGAAIASLVISSSEDRVASRNTARGHSSYTGQGGEFEYYEGTRKLETGSIMIEPAPLGPEDVDTVLKRFPNAPSLAPAPMKADEANDEVNLNARGGGESEPLGGAGATKRSPSSGTGIGGQGQAHRKRMVGSLATAPARPQFTETAPGTEVYSPIVDNGFVDVRKAPLSTISIDVDTASYANVRRFLSQNRAWPPQDAVRIEELVNYFDYDYAPPRDNKPFAGQIEIAGCPWNAQHRLVQVGIKAREIPDHERPASNLVFLLDVSGSMADSNKLPLVKQALALLIRKLGENDRVSIVVYAGDSGVALPGTSCHEQAKILAALGRLQAGGSTNGGSGIELAYLMARNNFIRGGTNRVILCTDGDFNVGITDRAALVRVIEAHAKGGVFLNVFGFGMGNIKDATLELLADKGNGKYDYVDSFQEAKKLFVDQMSGTLVTVAKDVKFQIEFNPAVVQSYRLIGYENRLLQPEDFNDDKKDAGEIGAGHTVTALYEVVPAGKPGLRPGIDALKYQPMPQPLVPPPGAKGEMLTLKINFKQPDQDQRDKQAQLQFPVTDSGKPLAKASDDFRFAAAVAAFGMILRDSPYRGDSTLDGVLALAQVSQGNDRFGNRAAFVDLVRTAKDIGH